MPQPASVQINATEQEIALSPKFDTEEIRLSAQNIFKRRRVLDNFTTENAYQDSKVFDARFLTEKIIHMKNKHASNVAKYKVLACINPTIWETIKAEATLAGNTSILLDSGDLAELGKPIAFIKIQVASNVADTPATIDAFISGQK
jgi:hypothetical protein